MATNQDSLLQTAEVGQALERAIQRQINRRTWGRIQALDVEVTDTLIVVRGRAPSYYFKQLALQGVHDLIESSGPMRIEMNINVVGSLS
jgi:hypothetical protein